MVALNLIAPVAGTDILATDIQSIVTALTAWANGANIEVAQLVKQRVRVPVCLSRATLPNTGAMYKVIGQIKLPVLGTTDLDVVAYTVCAEVTNAKTLDVQGTFLPAGGGAATVLFTSALVNGGGAPAFIEETGAVVVPMGFHSDATLVVWAKSDVATHANLDVVFWCRSRLAA